MTEPAQAPVFAAVDLHRSYDGRKVVDGFSTSVEAGEVAVLVGPNGCGKTTTVEMGLGLRRPDSGSAAICGHDVHHDAKRAALHVGVALQGASLNLRVRVREHLQFFAALFGTDERTFAIARDLGLDDIVFDSLYGSLSGGQQRRVLVATALAGLPALAVLDEPTSGVDIESRIAMWDALRRVQAAHGTAFLVTTHDLGEAEQYADKIIVMRRGSVEFDGRPGSFVRSTGLESIATVRRSRGLDPEVLPAVAGSVLRSSTRDVTYALTEPGEVDRLRAWVDGDDDATLEVRTPSFEDAYLFSFGSQPTVMETHR